MNPLAIPMVDLVRKYHDRESELLEAVTRVLQSGRYIGGGEVGALEAEIARYLGVDPEQVISCANGSDALRIVLTTAQFPRQSEVIIATHNYIAAAEAALACGLVPVWADTANGYTPKGNSRVSFQISTQEEYLDLLRTERTVAIIAVNLYGTPFAGDELRDYCTRHHLLLIEDNAQGMGGMRYSSTHSDLQPLGLAGDASIASFFPSKTLGGCGDGGMIVVPRNRAWAHQIREHAHHGQSSLYEYQQVGCNSRLDAIQAAWLRVQLRYLDRDIVAKNRIAQYYDKAWESLPGIALEEFPDRIHGAVRALYQYTLCVPQEIRNPLMKALAEKGIETRIYYPKMLHQVEVYRSYSRTLEVGCPNADRLSGSMLSLPIDALQPDSATMEVVDRFSELYQSLYRTISL